MRSLLITPLRVSALARNHFPTFSRDFGNRPFRSPTRKFHTRFWRSSGSKTIPDCLYTVNTPVELLSCDSGPTLHSIFQVLLPGLSKPLSYITLYSLNPGFCRGLLRLPDAIRHVSVRSSDPSNSRLSTFRFRQSLIIRCIRHLIFSFLMLLFHDFFIYMLKSIGIPHPESKPHPTLGTTKKHGTVNQCRASIVVSSDNLDDQRLVESSFEFPLARRPKSFGLPHLAL